MCVSSYLVKLLIGLWKVFNYLKEGTSTLPGEIVPETILPPPPHKKIFFYLFFLKVKCKVDDEGAYVLFLYVHKLIIYRTNSCKNDQLKKI